ncbi:MAG: alanyl-tRNA editing protein [Halopseudomonas sp.]
MGQQQAMFNQHPYQTELDAQVIATEENKVMLDHTLFYPAGGGQPGDQGVLRLASGTQLSVTDTHKGEKQGEIWHLLNDQDHRLVAGDTLTLQLDWPRRHRLMRMHTALHLLCSLVPKGVTGGSVNEQKSRLDFDLGDAKVDKQQLTEAINHLIKSEIAVTQEWISDAELDANPELVRTMSVQPPRGVGRIRMVKIAGVDYQPCGGTHVANTAEIGSVTISKVENKGKRNRRIHLLLDV